MMIDFKIFIHDMFEMIKAECIYNTPLHIRLACVLRDGYFYDGLVVCRQTGTVNFDGDPLFFTGAEFWNGSEWVCITSGRDIPTT